MRAPRISGTVRHHHRPQRRASLRQDRAARRSSGPASTPALITVPAGETAKSLKTVQACYDQLARHRLERKSFIVALGGGVVGDLAGFVAATYLRGIAFVQVPTTLLAQVDSSVGGKVGVNLKAGKNLVGAFYQPRLVLCDLDTLETLPAREFRAGLAEVIKYGIIYDAALFRAPGARSARAPAAGVQVAGRGGGPLLRNQGRGGGAGRNEGGLRAILNFGHTIGHGLEAISQLRQIPARRGHLHRPGGGRRAVGTSCSACRNGRGGAHRGTLRSAPACRRGPA